MDMRSWKNILLQWISECGFAERNYFNLEHSDIEKFYTNFSKKHHKIASGNYPELWDFLQQFYPEFEVNRDDDNGLSSADYIYVYTLMLHFSCVKNPETFFHDICQKLPNSSQQSMALFFRELLPVEKLNKENLRHAVAEVIASHTSPRSSDSISRSNGGLTPGASIKAASPLRTPKRNIGTQRNSPLTPKTHLLEERTRELFALRAQLDTERYEKGLLEIQIKQNEDKILKLNQDHKRLIQQIQELKIDVLMKTNENNSSVDREGDEHNQAQKRLLKEISQKDNEIIKLSETLRATEGDKILAEEKLTYNERQIAICGKRIELLEFKINDLTEEIEKRDNTIKYLTDTKVELEQFIAETRAAASNASIEVDSSFSRTSEVSSESTPIEPENLAVSVIDKQLREKEHENAQLREDLHMLNGNNKLLAEHIQELIKLEMSEFKITLDDLSESDSETDIPANCDPIAQFNMFASCMEKINIHHQLEKNKIKSLEHEIIVSQKENLELARKLDSVLDDTNLLKNDLSAFEQNNKELEETKERLQNSLRNCEAELKHLKEQLANSEKIKESSTEEMNALKTKLHQIEKINAELTGSNTQLKEQSEGLQNKLQDFQEKWMTQTKCLEEQIKILNDQLQKQYKELKVFQDAELALKSNYEQILIRNERLKENCREATEHLNTMRNELTSKERQMSSLGVQISNLTMKNADLEKRIDILMQEYKQEKQQLEKDQDQGLERIKELDNEIFKLNEELARLRIILENSEFQGIHLKQTLEQVQRKVIGLLKLCSGNSMPNSSVDTFEELEYHIKSLIEQNSIAAARLETLEVTQQESNTRLNDLLKQVQEKERMLNQRGSTYEELLVLRAQNIEYEDKIEKLKDKQSQFIEQIKSDLNKKENELRRQMKEAKLEHEQRLKELNKELKCEKEHKNNKERELLLVIAEHNEVKSRLSNAEKEVCALQEFNGRIRINYERLLNFEKRVMECCEENERFKLEIHAFKHEVSKNAQYLIDSDKAICKLMEEVKNCDYLKKQIKDLQGCLNQGIKKKEMVDKVLMEHKHLLDEKEIQIGKLQERLNEQSQVLNAYNDKLTKMTTEKERLLRESAAFVSQIQREQEEKSILLSSLENSADQMRANIQEEESRCESLERLNNELHSQLESLRQQNEKLRNELSEREAEFRAQVEDQEQIREDFQEKLSTLMRKLAESCDELENYDIALMDMVVVIGNNVNLTAQKDEIKNIFNACDDSSECSVNQLRHWLNRLLHVQSLQENKIEQLLQQEDQNLNSKEELIKENQELNSQLERNQKELHDMRKKMENKDSIMQKRFTNEVGRLEEEILSLGKINERITSENGTLQSHINQQEQEFQSVKLKLEETTVDKQQLTQQLRQIKEEMEKLQVNLHECQIVSEQATISCDMLDKQNKDKLSKIKNLEQELDEFKEKTQRTQSKLYVVQQQHNNMQMEHKKLLEKFKQQQTVLDTLEAELADKSKELLNLETKITGMENQHKELEKEIAFTIKKLDETVNDKLNAELKCEQLRSEVQQYERDIAFLKSQQQNFIDENNRLCSDLAAIKADKVILRDEIKDLKADLLRANENVSQLIQQIGSIRMEKEGVCEENQLLRKQLEEVGKHHTTSEARLKSFIERCQSLERHLLASENELKNSKTSLEKSETNIEKLTNENKKVRESHQATTKRVEKMALKLGDAQARSIKLERDNEKLCKTLEANSATVEALQKEKDLLQSEARALKERLSRAERGHEQLLTKVQNLEHINRTLQDAKQKLDASELDDKSKINKLEKVRESNEEKVRKLTASLNSSEHSNVKLNLEIGGLNSQLQKLNSELSAEYNAQIEQIQRHLSGAQEQAQKYAELNQNLTIQIDELQDENAKINEQLSKVSLSMSISKERCDKLCTEMEQLRADLLVLREAKAKVEREQEIIKQSLKEMHARNEQLMRERNSLAESLESRIDLLEDQIKQKTKEVENLQNELKQLREKAVTQSSELTEGKNVTATSALELAELRARLSNVNEALEKEQQLNEQLRSDNQLLHGKYQEAKKHVAEATAHSEERIKGNRLELEKILEKMKAKMKTLYIEDVTKIKKRHENELATLKADIETYKAQNAKYEEHTRKLSTQIVRLNENILECQKENTILSTKLKHIRDQQPSDEKDFEKMKRPNTIQVSTVSSNTTTGRACASSLGSNLAMEDEEGEIFNNTYLTDLKMGRMSDYMSRDVCVEELKHRNSMLPPHLRSTYAARFDHELTEDDFKDCGSHSFDDSTSALLNTAGTRKKCSGVTHYKRPGPPTPSKNGGRLSFGGSSIGSNAEPSREILKESNGDNNAGSNIATKTPARFNIFSSRFSLGNSVRDENNTRDLRKALQKKNARGDYQSSDKVDGRVWTSTPRKSKIHFDQRRLLDQLISSSPSPSPLAIDPPKNTLKEPKKKSSNLISSATPLKTFGKITSNARDLRLRQNSKYIRAKLNYSKYRNSSAFKSRLSKHLQKLCTPTSSESTSSAPASATPYEQAKPTNYLKLLNAEMDEKVRFENRLKQCSKREKGIRPSIYLTGNIFAKYRPKRRGEKQQDLQRHKSRNQRFDDFNRFRRLNSTSINQTEEHHAAIQNITYNLKESNNNNKQRNKKEFKKDVTKKSLPQQTYAHYDGECLCARKDEEKEDNKIGGVLCHNELITSQDLENFDQFVAIQNDQQCRHLLLQEKSDNSGSRQFEELLTQTVSTAPFQVDNLQFKNHDTFTAVDYASSSDANPSIFEHETSGASISTTTPHLVSTLPETFTRTIYGSHIIYNHRLPRINTTFARKSSIYVKNKMNSSKSNDIILITDQTITLADLLQMWNQMDNLTKFILCFAALASLFALAIVASPFLNKR
ncbi:mushroom body defect isoform 1-T1 [Glossina fuscipes fuscipes]